MVEDGGASAHATSIGTMAATGDGVNACARQRADDHEVRRRFRRDAYRVTNLVIRAGAMVFTTHSVKGSRRRRTQLRDNPRTRCSSSRAQRTRIGCRGRARLVDYLFHRDRPTFRPTLVRAAASRR